MVEYQNPDHEQQVWPAPSVEEQKMPCSVRQTYLDNKKVSEVGKANWSKNSLQLNDCRRSSKDSRISSFNLRNIDQRCAILTFPTLESDGRWRIVALPLQYFDQTNRFGSGTQLNMNGLHLVSSPSINSFKVDGWKAQKGPQPEITYSAKPFRDRSFSGSNMQHQFHNRTIANKMTKLNEVSNNSSCHSSIAYNDSSAVMSNASNPSAMFIDCLEEYKYTKRNSRKKPRRKGKHKKKHLCDVHSRESEVCSEYTRGSSASEICGNNDINSGSHGTLPEVSPSDGLLNITDFADSSNSAVTIFQSPKICTSDIDEVDLSEFIVPSQVQKLPREPHADNSEIGSEDQQLSRCKGDIERRHPSHMGSVVGIHQKGFSDMCGSLMLDSVSFGSNSEDGTSAGHSVNQFNDNSHEISQSELPGSSTKKGSFNRLNSLCSISETRDCAEGTKLGLAHSSFDGGIIASGKRGKQFKSIPGSSSPCKFGSIGNLHSRMGAEKSHSVWQKVQKNAVEKCNTELKTTSPICSQFDVTLKDSPLLKRNSNASYVTTLPITDDKKRVKHKVPRKLKRKVSPASRQENCSSSRKESHPNKVNLNSHVKSGMPKSEILDVLTSLDDPGVIKSLSRSCSQLGCVMVETMKSESVNDFQVGPSRMEPCESVCDTASGLNNITIENQDSLLQKSCVPLDHSNLLEVHTPVFLPHLMVNGVAQTEKEISLAENGKQSHNLNAVLQKWIPIGIKDPGFTTTARSANLSLEHSNEPDAKEETFKITFEEKVAPCSKNLSSENTGTMCSIRNDSRLAISSPENENHIQKVRNLNACVNDNEDKQNGANFFIDETKEQNLSATDLSKIAKALNEAYRAQMASEAVQMATGSPIAEFERLLHFCSPVICHSYSSVGCQTCLLDQRPSALLCRHEIPNIRLGCLWQWYEKHGSYGLEIRAEDYESPRRLSVDQFEFRAYFVPFLSAVQVFRNSKSHSTHSNTRISSPGVSKACDIGSTSLNSTNVDHLPIFSVLVPQSHTTEPSSQSQVNDVVRSEPSAASSKDMLPVESVDLACSDCLELVFEYFESEQPQQRRALCEKIQELVRGDVSPQCKMYGDPVNLNSINIHDLHPRSWYSVAWYPIYRIPDGNFRAAFLTYHSLGHFVRRSSKFDYPSVDSCIVSPVVGLQSYNAQGECWFQPRHSTMNDTSGTQSLIPSEILKERLRTLEETASLMARAVVNKGIQTSVNRHPDYEFFLSRQRQ
ncbi:uncharacterized protein LOC111276844 isoform X3 [Durio zibethinus]|uniref:Uncharacterized protein LOC111276844 isoform X3 n=1 Tax=Durio zibethinus TaxID=66656 RepID=A0A6P5WQU6_DURZI|nr:uncharacterized protein LOC111276844 isoform X3 [Durio zibethinus]